MNRLSMGARLGLTALGLLAAALAVFFWLPRDGDVEAAPLRIGAGDDVTGVLLSEITACAEADGQEGLVIGSYLFVDCCAGSAQWALQADEIDMGFYCSQAALEMVNANSDFEIYGPVVSRGEVLARRTDGSELDILGIPRKRAFLQDIVETAYPSFTDCQEINRTYLLYALEEDLADAVVLDVGDARRCGEDVSFLPASETPYISYCMVVRRSVVDTPAFAQFLTCYEQAVDRLNTPERLVETMGMDEAFWETAGTAFLHIT